MEQHTPVLLQETLDSLSIEKKQVVVDATLGMGGHSIKMIEKMQSGIFVGIDQDSSALEMSRRLLTNIPDSVDLHFVEGNFRNIEKIINDINIKNIDRILVDLGWGSHHLSSGRGFSFNKDEKLDMCYSTKENGCAVNAFDVVNGFEEHNLYSIIRHYGEERWAKRIAKFIIDSRLEKPIETTKELATIISAAVPRKLQPRNIHIATKTFQAIRITVNNEIENLNFFLDTMKKLVNKDSRIAIITFHSIEDRIVKKTFREWENEGLGKRYAKKAIKPSKEEIENNPRSRSAKLRTFITI